MTPTPTLTPKITMLQQKRRRRKKRRRRRRRRRRKKKRTTTCDPFHYYFHQAGHLQSTSFVLFHKVHEESVVELGILYQWAIQEFVCGSFSLHAPTFHVRAVLPTVLVHARRC